MALKYKDKKLINAKIEGIFWDFWLFVGRHPHCLGQFLRDLSSIYVVRVGDILEFHLDAKIFGFHLSWIIWIKI